MRVALVGVGTMGLPMGRNLLAAGHELVACDVAAERAVGLGCAIASSPAEAAAAAEVTILSLPAVQVVEEVVLGRGGVAEGAAPGAVVVDMSTSPPALARRLAAALAEHRLDFLDAPVSGGPRGAEEATLTIMVGGDAEVFERTRPVLDTLGSFVVHVGGHGAGQVVKLCNNLMAGCNMAAAAEACAIAEREGLDPKLFYEVVTASTGDSRVLRTRFPLAGADERHPVNREFEPMFALDLIAKDLGLARELAAAAGITAAMVDAALIRYAAAQAEGLGGLDYSAVVKPLTEEG